MTRFIAVLILLAERADQAPEIRTVLRARDRVCPGLLGDVVSLDDVLPGTPSVQREKLAIVDDIRALLQDSSLDDDDAKRLATWLPPADLAIITPADLPPMVARLFRDVNGEMAPLVLAYRGPQISFWNGRELLRLADLVRSVEVRDGTRLYAGGNVVVFADLIEVIARDGPIATIAYLLGVALLVLALAGGVRVALVVLAALVTGALWMRVRQRSPVNASTS